MKIAMVRLSMLAFSVQWFFGCGGYEVPSAKREDTALRMDLEAALERLGETSRAVVWLHDVEGYTHDEIAGMMGKTASFSKSQLARAHVRLRGWLGEESAS